MRFPDVIGANLEGKRYHLPRDFEGQFNIVILAFDRWHQALVDTWTPALMQAAIQYPTLHYYEIPTLMQYDLREQQVIDGWMRAGIPDGSVRSLTITLYTDLTTFFNALGIYVNTIYTLLLDCEGQVLWRTTGAYMPEKMNQLMNALTLHQERIQQ